MGERKNDEGEMPDEGGVGGGGREGEEEEEEEEAGRRREKGIVMEGWESIT